MPEKTRSIPEDVVSVMNEKVSHLLEIGFAGDVRYEEVMEVFSDVDLSVESNQDTFDRVVTVLEDHNIAILPEEIMEQGEVDSIDPLENVEINDSVGLYLRAAITDAPLLTAEEEVKLSQKVESGIEARKEMLKSDEVKGNAKRLLKRRITEGFEASETLINSNLRLVISVAKKYMYHGVPFLDLIQVGNEGLIRGAKKFDYKRGHKFSTYVTWWIRQAITRSISEQGSDLRIPSRKGLELSVIRKRQRQLTQKLGREPTNEELSLALPENYYKTPEQIESLIKGAREMIRLNESVNDEDDTEVGDLIQSESDTEELATASILRKTLEAVLSELPSREREILERRFGFFDGNAYTLEEVGHKMGVTRERIRQLEAQALGRLREERIKTFLEGYLDET